jgi:HK97 family phage prohead protease
VDPAEFFDALALVPNWRTATFNDMEMKPQKSGFHFSGHAAVFDEEAELGVIPGVGRVTESVQRGAFRKVLQQDANIPFTLEHDETRVFATTRSKRLKLAEDTKGLAVDADLPDTSLARDLFALVESDVVNGMSFGFVAGQNFKVEQRSDGRHRTLVGFKKLLDVTATWNPTYRSAEAQFRSLTMQYVDSPESLQQLLMGAYPQLQEQGIDTAGTHEEETPADIATPPDGAEAGVVEGELSGVVEQRTASLSVAARRRRLSLYLLTHGGVTHEA